MSPPAEVEPGAPHPVAEATVAESSSLRAGFWLGSIDLGPVALFRIAFGLAAAGSVLDLAPILLAGFSSQGFVVTDGRVPRLGQLGVIDLGNSPPLVVGAWLLCVAAVAAFILGFHARVAAAIVWLIFGRFTRANPLLFDASDQVIKLVMFWSMFIPLGQCTSLDARRARARGRALPRTGRALPLRILQLQVAWIYLSTFLLKLPGNTWRDGTAVYLALGLQHYFTRPLGYLMLRVPWTTQVATYFTLLVESTFLPLVFWPRLQPAARCVALAGGLALHLGILATMCIGGFSWVMIGTYPIFFEPRWARTAIAAFARRPTAQRGALAAGPAPAAVRSPPARPSGERTPLPVKLGQLGLALLLAACVWTSAPLPKRAAAPAWLPAALHQLDLAQHWNMFAPDPGRIDFWLRGIGTLADGSVVDALRGDEHGGPMPPAVHGWFGTRWAYVNDVVGWGDPETLRAFGAFLCRHWNEAGPPGRPALVQFEIHSVQHEIPLPGEPMPPEQDIPYFEHRCSKPAASAGR